MTRFAQCLPSLPSDGRQTKRSSMENGADRIQVVYQPETKREKSRGNVTGGGKYSKNSNLQSSWVVKINKYKDTVYSSAKKRAK